MNISLHPIIIFFLGYTLWVRVQCRGSLEILNESKLSEHKQLCFKRCGIGFQADDKEISSKEIFRRRSCYERCLREDGKDGDMNLAKNELRSFADEQKMFLLKRIRRNVTSEVSEITTRERKNVTLPCKTSNGQSGIWHKTVWYKGLDKVISISNKGYFFIYYQRKHPITIVDKESIRLYYVDRYDHGNYSCRALYLDGSDIQIVLQNVTLLVKARPLISTKSPRNQNLTHNASKPNLALDCTVNAFPKADVEWQKIDGQLPKSKSKQESNGTLVIHEASAEDSGTYRCSAVNELGRDQLNFIVTVFARPESPTIISVETTDREALVTWTFNNDGGLELNALILQYRKGEEEWNEIHIKPLNKNKYTVMYLDPDTNYNFRILVTNDLGTSTPSSNYFAKTKKTDNGTKPVTIAISVTSCVFIMALLLAVVYCRRRKMYNPFSLANPLTDLKFEFDAFIIYSSHDSEWVVKTLLPTLEEKHGLKCCVHYRDFTLGIPIRQNMVDSVYKCKKTVAVVSANFFSSSYCGSELDYALHRLMEKNDDSLVVIKLDDVDRNKLPKELQNRSYIDYPRSIEKEIWEKKLVKCLKVTS